MIVSQYDVPIVLMHMRGTPDNMQRNPHYTDAVEEIVNELEICISRAKSCNISPDKIILDPGIGFGKRLEDNLAVLNNLARFRNLGYPLLIGLSRKSISRNYHRSRRRPPYARQHSSQYVRLTARRRYSEGSRCQRDHCDAGYNICNRRSQVADEQAYGLPDFQ